MSTEIQYFFICIHISAGGIVCFLYYGSGSCCGKISFSYRYDKLCDFLVRVNTTLSMQIQLSVTGVVFPQTAITLERNSSILPETLVERIEGTVYQNRFPPA